MLWCLIALVKYVSLLLLYIIKLRLTHLYVDWSLNAETLLRLYWDTSWHLLPLDYKLFSRVKQVSVNNPLVHDLQVRPDRFDPEREEQRHLLTETNGEFHTRFIYTCLYSATHPQSDSPPALTLPRHCRTRWWLCTGCWGGVRLVPRWACQKGPRPRPCRKPCGARWSAPGEGWGAPTQPTESPSHLHTRAEMQ